MSVTRTHRHQDYELLCSAKLADAGRFVPALVVSRQVWPSRPREIAVERGEHLSEEAALEAAYQQGVAWVLNYG